MHDDGRHGVGHVDGRFNKETGWCPAGALAGRGRIITSNAIMKGGLVAESSLGGKAMEEGTIVHVDYELYNGESGDLI